MSKASAAMCRMRCLIAALMVVLAAAWLPPSLASTKGAAEVPPSTMTAIEALRGELDGMKLPDTVARTVRADLEAAAAQDKEATRFVSEAQALREQTRAISGPAPVPPGVDEQREQLRSWISRLPRDADAATLERLITQEQAAAAELRNRMNVASGDLARLISRPGTDSRAIATLQSKIEAAAAPVVQQADEAPAATDARRLRRTAEQRRAMAEIALYDTQQATAQTRQSQLERQLSEMRLELDQREPRIAWLTTQITVRDRERLQAQARRFETLARSAPAGASGDLLRENATLARQLRDGGDALESERRARIDNERKRDLIATALQDTEARLRIGGSSEATGRWMWQQRLALPSIPTVRAELANTQAALGGLRVDLFSITQQRHALTRVSSGETLADAAALAGTQAKEDPSAAASQDAADIHARAVAEQALAEQNNLLDDLSQELQRRIGVLEQSQAALTQALEYGTRLGQTFDRELLWMRSHAPVDANWLRQAPADVAATLAAVDLRAAWAQVSAQAAREPLFVVLGMAVLALLVPFARRAGTVLAALAAEARHPFNDSLRLILRASLWTLVSALPLAAALWLLSALMVAATDPQIMALGMALRFVSGLVFAFLAVRAVVAPGGLAEAHFGWSARRLQAFRHALPAVAALLIPGILATIVALHGGSARGVDSLGRMAVILMSVGMAILARRFMREASGSAATFRPSRRSEYLSSVGVPALFLAVTLLALLGYVFSAMVLMGALLSSMAVLIAVLVIDSLLTRWLLMRERQLALKRIRERPVQPDVADTEAGEKPTSMPDAELALVKIGEQARRFVRLIRYLLLALGLVWAWSDVVPALLRLDEVVLWHSSVLDAEGRTIPHPVSMMSVLAALLLIVMTVTLSRNMPGALEMLLSVSPHVTASARYTLVTLMRYALTIAGMVAAVGMLGLRWSQLQWLAAALTVGLGFGLQEIFANFVSGLILLVERPFRVGDTITVGQLNGTVKRIQTRATTVVDYENRENIIPNKNFITGQIVNWTLSDTVTRVVVPVSVAYGSDLARVRTLLLQAASEMPQVLDDPPPRAWVLSLGDSAVNLDLRVYVGGIGDRLQVSNDLNERIVALLAEHGIEIPFPQMDLHVRDMPPRRAAAVRDAALGESGQSDAQRPGNLPGR